MLFAHSSFRFGFCMQSTRRLCVACPLASPDTLEAMEPTGASSSIWCSTTSMLIPCLMFFSFSFVWMAGLTCTIGLNVQILDLEDAISQLKVIHVAGTKGKVGNFGSAFAVRVWYWIHIEAVNPSTAGFHVLVYRIDPPVLWVPHWTFHFASLDRCPGAISTWWVRIWDYRDSRSAFVLDLFFLFNLVSLRNK